MTNDEARERKVLEAEQASGRMVDELRVLRAAMEEALRAVDRVLERVEHES